ncbi:uncharacterized protein MONOS_4964 [Monocercomonoides exilis]|uniref:uncharacterized protein n=1 Tax=Monocercomonoides exilis TaxID=2049356 RepID=UPI00355A1C6D|nr:hypothetical protein MONOS_4964 [Monocercomonoides exilis]|eukprot:MONOS_4964.1-p1 / transcript=MONOS_4964.1 / gene=MONOS_4964 / organism=Monocercomonoides_exilis_PA203 / gene_product=unspecified product / transcript_product=unspecified product / location=Mono_scaffold00139:42557-43746(+) / protein_length=278 / sequence_SO=supercontig / SO=protein_coding / is_pseudo=false
MDKMIEEKKLSMEDAILLMKRIGYCEMVMNEIRQELYLDEIKEIIEYHQEHQNLTRLAYQSAWEFLVYRLHLDKSLEDVIVNELHFGREAAKELEELSKCVDWKRKEDDEVLVVERWLIVVDYYFSSCTLWNEEIAGLINCIVQVLRASRDNHKDILNGCLYTLRYATENRNVEVDDLLKSGAIGLYWEEMKQSTLDDRIVWNGLNIFLNISKRLKEKTDGETDETKRKELKRKIFERMEEEGYEDAIISFHEIFDFLHEKNCYAFSLNTSDYFVNV